MKTAHKKCEFKLTAEPGSKVSLAGTFNGWDASKHRMKPIPRSRTYKAAVTLPPGKHEYKFVVDGLWLPDPLCPQQTPDGHGSYNSVICV